MVDTFNWEMDQDGRGMIRTGAYKGEAREALLDAEPRGSEDCSPDQGKRLSFLGPTYHRGKLV